MAKGLAPGHALGPGEEAAWDQACIAGTHELDRLRRAADDLYPEVERARRKEAVIGTITTAPRVRTADRLRAAATRSDFYQRSRLATPVRVAFNMRPQSFVNLHDPSGDVQIARFLRQSGMPQDAQDAFRSAYMAEAEPAARQAVLVRAEEAAVGFIAKANGLTDSDLARVLMEANKGRRRAQDVLKSRVYDGEGRSLLRFMDDEDGVMHELPLLVTQEANLLPLVDLDEIGKAAREAGRLRSKIGTAGDLADDVLTKFYRAWKPATLLRVGWPIRVVGDEQLRILAKIGAMSQLRNLNTGLRGRLQQRLEHIPKDQRVPGNPRPLNVDGYALQNAYGMPGDTANIYADLVSSRASFDKFLGRSADKLYAKLIEQTGEWRSLSPVASSTDELASYGPAWEHAVNKQLGRDAMGRQFLEGRTVDEVTDWLRSTDQGQVYAGRLPFRRDLRRWAQAVSDQVDSYTAGSDDLRALALRGKATAADLSRVVPDAAMRPVIHGEILAQATGASPVMRLLNNIVETGYKALGSLPSDTLSRHPYFDYQFRAEAVRLSKLLDEQLPEGTRLDGNTLRLVEKNARERALVETRSLLYDLAEESQLARMLRFFMPYANAWQEVLTRWTGLAVENPAFVARMRMVWQAPEKMGLLTDEDGNTIRPGDDPEGDTYLTFRLPEFVKDWPFVGDAVQTESTVSLNRASPNMLLQGMPGFGPVVQMPVNELVKDRPDLEAAARWILPYGTTQETWTMVLPPSAKRAYSMARGEEDRAYRNMLMRVFYDKVVDYNLAKRDDPPTYAEAKAETDAIFKIRLAASYISPVAPTFRSPYQVIIDDYRQLREADPENADERFLEKWGADYFPLTQSLSKSIDGVPPTIEGHEARQRYVDLIEKYPELGSLIVGAEGAGEFSRAVYDSQLASRVAPGSSNRQRESPDFEEASIDPERRLGWTYYGKAMDLIDAVMAERGLPNLQVKAARELAGQKRQIIAALAAKYPAWYEDFQDQDRGKWAKRVDAFREIVKDERLKERPTSRAWPCTYKRAIFSSRCSRSAARPAAHRP